MTLTSMLRSLLETCRTSRQSAESLTRPYSTITLSHDAVSYNYRITWCINVHFFHQNNHRQLGLLGTRGLLGT